LRKFNYLTAEQVDQFLTRGYIVLHDCFPREWAEIMTSFAFERLGYDPNDPDTWEKPRVHMPNVKSFPMRTHAPKAWNAACELLGGEDRVGPCSLSDGFIINFGIGASDPWREPGPNAPGWHKDGGFFRHYLDSPEQGLLSLVWWSDTESQGGGTFVAADSVPIVSRYLAEHRNGIVLSEFNFGPLVSQCHDFVEVTGKVGDIVLLHPFILHASSQNLKRKARFLTNPPFHLKEPMQFDRENPDDFSLVELSILRGLGVDHLEYEPGGPRERVPAAYQQAQAEILAAEQARLSERGLEYPY
jgi:hypothetical protein